MDNLYNANGLIFWSEAEIKLRDFMIETFAREVQTILMHENQAWRFVRIEAPILTPRKLLNQEYNEQQIFEQTNENQENILALRPETTAGSYAYACHLLNRQSGYKAPLCVWQSGKSFRREPDQPLKHMRLKEFYQQEFQCIYAADSKNDYLSSIQFRLRHMIGGFLHRPVRLVTSDRLPNYSQMTIDIESDSGEKWMEVCSISRRTDFPQALNFQGKHGIIEKEALVLEIAIGLDRLLYIASITW